MFNIIIANKFLLWCYSEVLSGIWTGTEWRVKVGRQCYTMDDKVGEDERRNGFQRCQEFLGGAWELATIEQFSMEYIRLAL